MTASEKMIGSTGRKMLETIVWSALLGVITGSLAFLALLQTHAAGPPVFVFVAGLLVFFLGILVGTVRILAIGKPTRTDYVWTVVAILVLGVAISTPFVVVRQSNLSGGELGVWYGLEVLLAVFIPLSGILGAVYGWLRMQPILAFLIGALPYASFLLVEFRLSPFLVIPGIPMGFLGAAPALFRVGLRGRADIASVVGFVLFGVGLLLWLFFAAAVSNG